MSITLDDARDDLNARLDEGAHCPLCGQFAKAYRRKLTSHTARVLITMRQVDLGHRKAELRSDYMHLPTVLGRKQADEAKARYWGLIEQMPETRDDGSDRVGWWRLTDDGTAFVEGAHKIRKYVVLYDSELVRFEGPMVDITDSLGTRFDYAELMAGR